MVLAALAGCWGIESELRERAGEMADHESDALAARAALAAGDLAAAQAAGRRLAAPDRVPRVPPTSEPWLDRVRAGGAALSTDPTIPAAAERLVGLTADCAGCHRELGVRGPGWSSAPLEVAFVALAFESDDLWTAAFRDLERPEAATWPARRGWIRDRTLAGP